VPGGDLVQWHEPVFVVADEPEAPTTNVQQAPDDMLAVDSIELEVVPDVAS